MGSGNSKTRVLTVITRLIVGGAQETAIDTCHLLDPERYEVDLLIGPQLGAEGELVSTVNRDRVRLTTLQPLVREIDPLNDWRALRALEKIMRQGRYHIVHTHSSKAGVLGRMAARRAGVPVVVHTVHGWPFHDRMNPLKRRVYIAAEKHCLPMTDKLIVVTQLDAGAGIRCGIGGPDDYRRIFSAINLDEYRNAAADPRAVRAALGLDPSAPVAGCVARLSPQKAPDIFMRMAAEVSKLVPDAQFLYVGGGPLRADIEALIRELGLEGKVVLAGLRRDIPQLMAAMDVFVLLSLWEGLPRVFPQAMASGLPVVASRVGGAAEIVTHGDNGYLAEPGDYQTPARLVADLLRDPALRSQMGERGRQRVDPDFCVNHMVRQIDALYQELLRNKGITP
jgi:glycosyltransferase involved in cell wall biosynthesis